MYPPLPTVWLWFIERCRPRKHCISDKAVGHTVLQTRVCAGPLRALSQASFSFLICRKWIIIRTYVAHWLKNAAYPPQLLEHLSIQQRAAIHWIIMLHPSKCIYFNKSAPGDNCPPLPALNALSPQNIHVPLVILLLGTYYYDI